MVKILRIKKCKECPYFRKEKAYWCEAHCIHDGAFGKDIEKPNKIPEWCPLESE